MDYGKLNFYPKSLKWLILFLILSLTACQSDDFFVEDEAFSGLKNATLIEPGEWLPDCGYWDLQLPEGWEYLPERVLFVYCHGIVDPEPYAPVALPADNLAGVPVSGFILSQGWAYAATSYTQNGMVAHVAAQNVKKLVEHIKVWLSDKGLPWPDYWFVAGPSEGALVTVLSLERYPELFDGGIAVCGPIGSMYEQLQYNGDFHVLFNYFFPQLKFGNPVGVGSDAMSSWVSGLLQAQIITALQTYPGKTAELLKTSKVTIDTSDPVIAGTSLMELLRFNVMFTTQINQLLKGCAFNNKYKIYTGSSNDFMLNRKVERISTPDFGTARDNLKKLLETTGNINDPLITLHTTGDHIVPAWHQTLYRAKVWSKGKALYYTGIPVLNYGHCTISETDLQNALTLLFLKVKAREYLANN